MTKRTASVVDTNVSDMKRVHDEKDNGRQMDSAKGLTEASERRKELEVENSDDFIPETLLKKVTRGTWLGKSMLIDCTTNQIISKYILLYENGLKGRVFSRVLRRLYMDGSQDCSHAKGIITDDGLRADIRMGKTVWFLKQVTDTMISASVHSSDKSQPGLLSGGVLVQANPGYIIQTRHVTLGMVMNVEHTLLRRVDAINSWYESYEDVPELDMEIYRDEMSSFLNSTNQSPVPDTKNG
eukprot:CFRG2942T1